MVLLDDVIQVLALPDLNVGIRPLIVHPNCRPIGTAFVDIDQFRGSIVLDGLYQERLSTHALSVLGQQKVYRVPILVNGTIEVLPLPFHFDIGLVHPPPIANRSLPSSHFLFDLRSELEYPALNCRVIDLDTTNAEDLFHISIAQRKSKLEIHSLKNDRFGKTVAFSIHGFVVLRDTPPSGRANVNKLRLFKANAA